jgi:NAD(P)-dependent dehydrogenase (short-subunit alcohol dehydrogenase family)
MQGELSAHLGLRARRTRRAQQPIAEDAAFGFAHGFDCMSRRNVVSDCLQTEAQDPLPLHEPPAPMQEVAGKVAFITGGSSGIGLGIARAFVEAGMKVVLGYRTAAHATAALDSLADASDRVHPINVDVTDRPGMVRAAAETEHVFGKVHVLVNNAGVVGFAPLSATTYDDWDWIMNVNVNGVFNGVRTFLPCIRRHGEGGHIISLSSLVGLVAGGRTGSYTTSKFAVVGMMESLRAELAGTNIGVSVCCPGVVQSNFITASRNRPGALATTEFNLDPDTMAAVRRSIEDRDVSMDPFTVGRLVLRGMRNNDLYILTHPATQGIIKDRYEALAASFPRDLDRSEFGVAMTREGHEQSIYSIERDRKNRR